MMRSFAYPVLLATAAAVAVPAFAQGPSDAPTFTGPRVEGIVGWDKPKDSLAGSNDGVVYGLGLGYDMQAGGAVIGIEAEATDSSADARARNVTVPGDRLSVGVKRDLYVGGRVGTVVGNRALLYAKAGYTNARFGVDYDDGGNGANNYGDGYNLDGVRVGGGGELAITRNTFAKAEYRYSNYEKGVTKHQVVGGVGIRF